MRNVVYHDKNPYGGAGMTQHAAVYVADDYRLDLMLQSLQPISLRVFLYILRHLEPDGSVDLHPQVIARRIKTSSAFVSVGTRDLVKYNLIARNTRYRFWVSDLVAKPITLTVGQKPD